MLAELQNACRKTGVFLRSVEEGNANVVAASRRNSSSPFPRIDDGDSGLREVRNIAGGEGETVNQGGGGDEGIIVGQAEVAAEVGGLLGDGLIDR